MAGVKRELWPVYLPHGAKVHATARPPVNHQGNARGRVTLCGVEGYVGGPETPWAAEQRLGRCTTCENRSKQEPRP